MISRFFIDRPIFAWVIAIGIAIAGLLALPRLPITQYPRVAPPSVQISANYPGASGEIVDKTVTQLIEQQLSALDGFLYMEANSSSNGASRISVSFVPGTDADVAQVQVQNRVQQAMPRLPAEVQRQGVNVRKSAPATSLQITIYDTSRRMRPADLADFLNSVLVDPVNRTPGIGDLNVFGGQYAMRIWLDPHRLAALRLTPSDVVAAIQAENVQVSAGQLGALPVVPGQQLNAVVNVQERFTSADQFKQILLRTNPDGSTVRVEDVARVELGSESYNTAHRYNGHPAAAMAIRLAPEANALATIAAVKDVIEQLRPQFPPGVDVTYPIDVSPFIERSVRGVVTTLLEGIALVVVVIFLFLQNWRSTLIPAITVPIVLLGTFAVVHMAGMSINMLTMFGTVLAIGLLVDDAIVVVENVERLMRERNLSPLEATRESMREITSALTGIAVVLSAVFLPMAFFGGATGIIYRQFSVTLIAAMMLSLLVALTLTPALCAHLLKPHPPETDHRRGVFGAFNRGVDQAQRSYVATVGRMIPRRALWYGAYGLICGAIWLLFQHTPTAFLPEEDQGRINTLYMLPEGATLEQTAAVSDRVADHLLETEKDSLVGIFSIPGFSNSGSGQSQGQASIVLKDWKERRKPEQNASAIARRIAAEFSGDRQARIIASVPAPVPDLGNASGFDLQLLNVGGLDYDDFVAARARFLEIARADPVLANVRYSGIDDQPQLKIDIDRPRAGALGISQQDVNTLLSIALGGSYVNDFIDQGRVKRVYVQADAPFRMVPEDIGLWNLRTRSGTMAPFASVASWHWMHGPLQLFRFNGVPSFAIQGTPAPGESTGTAMQRVEQIVREMNAGLGVAWSGISRQEQQSSGQALPLYLLSLLVVFLALAALYESWTIPAAVILVVPLGIVGALIGANLRGMQNDILFQVGLLTTMGLAAKNAILIVEFAAKSEQAGMGLLEATLHAARLRLRPIVMTSLAFMAGVLPLMLASGAGAGGQNAIGTAVIGGMITGVTLSIFFVPLFYIGVRKLFGRRSSVEKVRSLQTTVGPHSA